MTPIVIQANDIFQMHFALRQLTTVAATQITLALVLGFSGTVFTNINWLQLKLVHVDDGANRTHQLRARSTNGRLQTQKAIVFYEPCVAAHIYEPVHARSSVDYVTRCSWQELKVKKSKGNVIYIATFLIFRFYKLSSPLHLPTMYRAFVAAGAAYDSLN